MNVSRAKLVGVALVIFAATVWLFWPSTHGDFLSGDDITNLRQSVRLHGLTWNAVTWALTCTDDYYHPLPRLFYILSYRIWGKSAAGHHANSVVGHALNAAFVFGFLWTLLRATSLTTDERLTVALWVAVVFAIHPLQVESVAWMAVRNQLLCTMFGIGSLWAYAADARRWLVWTLYVAALLCKPMAVSFPFVMLAMDYYPLRQHERLSWGRLLSEKAAMIALAAAASLATVITKSQIDQIFPLATIPLSERVFLAFESLTFYPLKLVWPSHLSPYYPMRLGLSLDQGPVLASVLSVVLITAVVVIERRRMPMVGAAWVSYVILVLPVSGLMPLGSQVVAQRYAYVAMLPLLLLAGAAGVWLWRRSAMAARIVVAGLLAGQLCVFAARTRKLIPLWHDDESERRAALAEFPNSEIMNRTFAMMLLDHGRASEALEYAQRDVEVAPQVWEAHMTLGSVLSRLGRVQEAMAQNEEALRLNPDPALGHYNFGLSLMDLGNVPEAAKHFEQALQSKPDFAQAHLNLGVELEKLGRTEDAVRQYREALRIEPDYAEAQANLGSALATQGRVQEAITHFAEALRIKPDFAGAYYNRGVILEQVGRLTEAIADYEAALRITPEYARPHFHLGTALEKLGRHADAIRQYEEALRIKPDYAEAHKGLGLALDRTGKVSEAARHYEQALRLEPDDPEAHSHLGLALKKMGSTSEAAQQYEQALGINPDYPEAQNNLAWLLATLAPAEGGDPVRAVALAEQACRLTDNRVATCLDTLATAYAAAGRFHDAVGTAQKAISLAESTAQTQLVSRIEMRLELYRANRAYYEPPNVTSPRTP
jgi:tetratricopeptide (TPR) repeat protein